MQCYHARGGLVGTAHGAALKTIYRLRIAGAWSHSPRFGQPPHPEAGCWSPACPHCERKPRGQARCVLTLLPACFQVIRPREASVHPETPESWSGHASEPASRHEGNACTNERVVPSRMGAGVWRNAGHGRTSHHNPSATRAAPPTIPCLLSGDTPENIGFPAIAMVHGSGGFIHVSWPCRHMRTSVNARIATAPFRDGCGLGKACRGGDAPWQSARGCGVGARTKIPYDGTAWAMEAYGNAHPIPPTILCLLSGDTPESKDSPPSSAPTFVATRTMPAFADMTSWHGCRRGG